MPGFLASTISEASAQQARHIGIPARLWLYVALFIGFVIFLLVLPVIWGAVSEAASSAAEKAAPGTFFLGLGVLFVGLVAGLEILDIIGASLAGLVIVGVIVDNYLKAPRGLGGQLERESIQRSRRRPSLAISAGSRNVLVSRAMP
jgi:hypothetical protein